MTTQEYLDLRNEASVRGVASVNAASTPVALTEEAVERIAEAFCVWLISHTGKIKVRVAIGHDSRPSSPALYQAVLRGITKTGHEALSFERVTLSRMFLITQSQMQEDAQRYGDFHGALYVTADTFTAEYNGLDFFYQGEKLTADDVREILQIACDYRFAEPNVFGNVIHYNILPVEEYVFHVALQNVAGRELGKELLSAYATRTNAYFVTLAKEYCQGVLLSYDDLHGDGWALLRTNTQDDVLSLSIESKRADSGIKIVKDLYYFLKQYDFIDVTALEEAIFAWREEKTLALKEKFTGRKLVRVQF